MKKIWKSKAYRSTKVDSVKSQIQINKLLNQEGDTTYIRELILASANFLEAKHE